MGFYKTDYGDTSTLSKLYTPIGAGVHCGQPVFFGASDSFGLFAPGHVCLT